MNEVRWVYAEHLNLNLHRHDVSQYLGEPKLVPVVTLDALEAWLEKERVKAVTPITSQRDIGRAILLDHLLAQVREWKEAGK